MSKKFPEMNETHVEGMISIENIPDAKSLQKADLGIQIAPDGRVWVCIDGMSFLRFTPNDILEKYRIQKQKSEEIGCEQIGHDIRLKNSRYGVFSMCERCKMTPLEIQETKKEKDVSELSDTYSAMRKDSQNKRANNRKQSAEYLKNAGIKFIPKNYGAHLIVEGKLGPIDYWPGTGRWVTRKGIKGFGIANLINFINSGEIKKGGK